MGLEIKQKPSEEGFLRAEEWWEEAPSPTE